MSSVTDSTVSADAVSPEITNGRAGVHPDHGLLIMYKVRDTDIHDGDEETWKLAKRVDPDAVSAYWDKVTARTGMTQRAWLSRVRFKYRVELAKLENRKAAAAATTKKRKRRISKDDEDSDYKPPGA
ncbi:hypothetical protein GCG54_00015607 [Colletotrichum gloeosporioides]|uniref:Uncharacterized protein n=1 Tax=Colletotrichum gloeosporioides TaxID=474922 RepID=A0A8H4CA67_COLGL|nr:uncharacterized protein GCG54_00015607 [Colletotrichum gloeosporioides]KAF3800024.1 hypothetical protein GCG54_00015607 [Colletotrichum gloeosporioides]